MRDAFEQAGAKSRFEFDVLSGVEQELPDGKTRFVAIPGTVEYAFHLHDFVALKPTAKPVGAGERRTLRIERRF